MTEKCEAHSALERIDARAKSNTRRIDKLEQDNVAINNLSESLKVMASEQGHLSAEVGKLNGKVEEICNKPNLWWETLLKAMIVALAGGFVAWLLMGGQ